MWCCRIEAERLQDFSGAFNNACCIATSGIEKSDSQKKELGRFLFGVSLLLDRFQQSEAMKLISQDLGLSGLPVALLKAHGLINRKENEQALIVLDEVREDGKEDPAWLGIYAQVLQSLGRNDEANACIVRQGEVMPLPELLKENALSLHEHGADDDAIQVLEKLLTEKPDDEYALYNLAVLYFHKGQIRQAIEWLNKLIKAKGLNDERRLFLAQTHFNLDEFDKVVEVLSPLCDKDPPLLEAVINSACALNHAQGPQSAFEFIKKYKDRFWNNPKFVGQYMTLAPAAGHEREMHLAMQQMMALDQASQGSTPMIQRIDLDEIKTMLKSSASQTRQWIDFEVQGIMPWIKRELMLNNAVYWGWRRRTYDCLWVMEDRYSRAENQIYVSNALNVQDGRAGTPELLPITLPEKNTDVVFDISALITLHELGFLEPAFDFFATVYLPVQYLAVSKQKNGLVPHQLSQLSFITEAKRLLVEQKIKPASDSSDVRRIVVDEYNPDDQVKKSAIGLAELLNYLREQGAFTEEQYEQIIRTVNRKRTSSESDLFDTPFVIQIALSSFGTLFHFKLHSALLECSEVCLSESDIDEVQRQSVAFDLQKATLEKHEHLWKWLHDHEKKGKLTFTSHTPCSELRDIISDEDRDIAFFSSSLARTKALPYCADDRACQLVGGVSFGTPQLLEALYEAKQITLQQYSEAFMRMIEWRYRFLLVPPEVMRFFAHSFKSALPGKELKKIAHYLHDCMRDEGLSSAQQPVEPPVPISMRYFMTWVSNIAEFLVDAWLDPDIEEKQLCLLTDWVAVEMLPSVPRTLKGVFHMRVGNLMQQTLISQLLIRSMTAKFPNRLDLAMSRIKSTLKISDETYTDIVTEVLRHVD
jgi:tetratricopeptide (TPR) repeat protein